MSLFDSGNKGVKFTNIGDEITGTVAGAPYERQQTKFGTQEAAFYPNGDPMMQVLVPLSTALREDGNDDGDRTLYVASKNMRRSIGQAIRDAGAADIEPGGVLTVKYIGNDPNSKNPANPAKLYEARYTKPAAPVQPTSAFAPQPPAAAQQPAFVPQGQGAPQFVPTTATQPPQQPVPAQPVQQAQQAPFVPATPQPHPSGLSQDQIGKLQQLRAAGIPEDTIATAIQATPQQIAAFDSTPF